MGRDPEGVGDVGGDPVHKYGWHGDRPSERVRMNLESNSYVFFSSHDGRKRKVVIGGDPEEVGGAKWAQNDRGVFADK